MSPDAELKLRYEAESLRARIAELEKERDENNPAAQALNDLWRDVILARKPTYGDWEYPGQAYRHLLTEFREATARAEAAEAERDRYLAAIVEAERLAMKGVRDINDGTWISDIALLLRPIVEEARRGPE